MQQSGAAPGSQFLWRVFQLAVFGVAYSFLEQEWLDSGANPESIAPLCEAAAIAFLATVAVNEARDFLESLVRKRRAGRPDPAMDLQGQ